MKKLSLIFVVLLIANYIFAVELSDLRIIADDGTFLGTLENEFASDSIFNEFGKYGNEFNSQSILNEFGRYGNEFSQYSPFNEYSNKGPILVDRRGKFYGRITLNKYASDVTDLSYQIAVMLKKMQESKKPRFRF